MSPDPLPAMERVEPFVDATLAAQARADQAVWSRLGWATIGEPEDQNMDLVPPYFDRQLRPGCPECGAAWQELLALGFTAPQMHSGEAEWDGCDFNVSTPARHRLELRAVRVRCHSEHSFDFDSYTGATRKHVAVSPWLMAVVGGSALLMLSAYVFAATSNRGGR